MTPGAGVSRREGVLGSPQNIAAVPLYPEAPDEPSGGARL